MNSEPTEGFKPHSENAGNRRNRKSTIDHKKTVHDGSYGYVEKWSEILKNADAENMTPEKLARLFTKRVSIGIASSDMYEAALWPEEQAAVTHSVPKRRREFCAGRAAARVALHALGAPPGPIVANADRTPRWPRGFVGSITHCDSFCGAVVARNSDVSSVGLDAETATPLPRELAGLIYDDREAAHFSALPHNSEYDWGKLAFSAKEAFYKCYYPQTKTLLDFRDISVLFYPMDETGLGSFSINIKNPCMPMARLADSFSGRWSFEKTLIYAGVTVAAGLPY